MSETAMLPPQFASLERFAPKWCRETEEERYSLRLGATMDELQDFYDAALPLGEEAQAYLDKFDLTSPFGFIQGIIGTPRTYGLEANYRF